MPEKLKPCPACGTPGDTLEVYPVKDGLSGKGHRRGLSLSLSFSLWQFQSPDGKLLPALNADIPER